MPRTKKEHYMMDCYHREEGRAEPVRRESKRIVAASDDDAIKEAKGAGSWSNPTFFVLRAVGRKTSRVVYRSEPAGD
jgi:hypothetical protein